MKTFNNLIVLQLAINFANLFIFPFMFMWSIGPIFPSSMVKLRFKSVPTVIPGIAKHSRRHQGPPLRRNLMFECKFIVSSLYYLLYYHCLYHQYCCLLSHDHGVCVICVWLCVWLTWYWAASPLPVVPWYQVPLSGELYHTCPPTTHWLPPDAVSDFTSNLDRMKSMC